MTGALVCSRISVKAFLFMEGPMSVAVVIVHGLEHGAQQNLPIERIVAVAPGTPGSIIREVLQIPCTTTTTIQGYQVGLACS